MATVLQDQDLNDQTNKAQNQSTTTAPGTSAPGGSTSTSTGGSTAPASYGASNGTTASTPQGSGSFTNLQKYLNANQQGGQEVAGGIGNNINNNLSSQEAQTNKYNQQLGQSVNNANQVAQQGAGYEQQLQGIGTNVANANYNANGNNSAYNASTGLVSATNPDLSAIQNFTNSPNFQNYLNIQSGNAINQNAINNQSQQALGSAQAAQQAAGNYQNQLGNEGGRFALLQQTYGGANNPNYTQGLQRLDQSFLGQGNALGQVQSGVNQQVQNTNSALNQANALGTAATNVNNEATGLINSYNTTNNANQQAYMNMLNSYIDPTNAARTQDVANLNSAIQSYSPPTSTNPFDNPNIVSGTIQSPSTGTTVAASAPNPYAGGFTAQQLAQLGVTGTNANTGVYNVFNKTNGVQSAGDIAQIGAAAQNAGDVASQADVDRYNALMKITNNPTATSQLTGPSTIGTAYTGNTDATGLGQRLTAAQTAFNTAANTNIYGGPGNQVYGNIGDVIQNGTSALKGNGFDLGTIDASGSRHLYTAPNGTSLNTIMNDPTNYAGGAANAPDPYIQSGYVNPTLNNLQAFLNAQNYNRTLGGVRDTFLDNGKTSYGNQYAGTNTPVTGDIVGNNYNTYAQTDQNGNPINLMNNPVIGNK